MPVDGNMAPHMPSSLTILLRDRTIREIKAMSRKKKVRLGDSATDEHTIVFYKDEMVEIICPKQKASESQKGPQS